MEKWKHDYEQKLIKLQEKYKLDYISDSEVVEVKVVVVKVFLRHNITSDSTSWRAWFPLHYQAKGKMITTKVGM